MDVRGRGDGGLGRVGGVGQDGERRRICRPRGRLCALRDPWPGEQPGAVVADRAWPATGCMAPGDSRIPSVSCRYGLVMWRTVTGIAWWHSSVTGRQEWSGIAGAGWPPLRVRSLGVVTECALAEERRRPARSARTCVRSRSPRRCAPAVVPDVGHHVGIGQPEVKGSQVQVLSARQRNRRWGAGRPTWATRLSCASATPLGGGAAAVPRREEVADDIAITVGEASKVIDRWERAELVRRVSNPSDRRSSLLQRTVPGSAALSEGDG
jgi:hypothetical protein